MSDMGNIAGDKIHFKTHLNFDSTVRRLIDGLKYFEFRRGKHLDILFCRRIEFCMHVSMSSCHYDSR